MNASLSIAVLLRAYVGEAEAWKREALYREMIEVFREHRNPERDGAEASEATRVHHDVHRLPAAAHNPLAGQDS